MYNPANIGDFVKYTDICHKVYYGLIIDKHNSLVTIKWTHGERKENPIGTGIYTPYDTPMISIASFSILEKL